MNPIPSDDEFREAYALVEGDQDALRARFVSLLPAGGVTYPLPDRQPLARVRLAGALAACLALAGVAWLAFFGVSPDRPAYALDGIHDRLLKVRSLYLKGWMDMPLEIDGKRTNQRCPIEQYVERPFRLWHTFHHFDQQGNAWHKTSSHHAFDGSRSLRMSETENGRTVSRIDPLAVELRVESMLQEEIARELIRGPTSEYRFAGTETQGGRPTLRYERVETSAEGRTRSVLWLNPTTGLPVRFAAYHAEGEGPEQPSLVYEEISFNVPPPRPEMFSFRPADGEEVSSTNIPGGDSFIEDTLTAGNDRFAVRPSFAVDSLAVLVCWRHTDAGPRETGLSPDVLMMPEVVLEGSARRECELIPLRTQSDEVGTWRWGLAVPRDRRPLDPSETLQILFAARAGGGAASIRTPLRLEDERLAKVLTRIQEQPFLKSPASAPEDDERLTPVRLRWKLTRILKQEADEKVDAERGQPELDLPPDDKPLGGPRDSGVAEGPQKLSERVVRRKPGSDSKPGPPKGAKLLEDN